MATGSRTIACVRSSSAKFEVCIAYDSQIQNKLKAQGRLTDGRVPNHTGSFYKSLYFQCFVYDLG